MGSSQLRAGASVLLDRRASGRSGRRGSRRGSRSRPAPCGPPSRGRRSRRLRCRSARRPECGLAEGRRSRARSAALKPRQALRELVEAGSGGAQPREQRGAGPRRLAELARASASARPGSRRGGRRPPTGRRGATRAPRRVAALGDRARTTSSRRSARREITRSALTFSAVELAPLAGEDRGHLAEVGERRHGEPDRLVQVLRSSHAIAVPSSLTITRDALAVGLAEAC